VNQHTVADETRRAIEAHLLDGSWSAGMRLPPERALARELGVCRNSVREAIFSLKARGLLTSRQGSGVYVTDLLRSVISSPWQQLLAEHPDLRWDTLEFRRELEGATAYFAALRADATDLRKIEGIVERLNRTYETGSEDRNEEHRADADFHEAIAEASHNTLFLYLHSSVLRLLREHISLNLIGLESHTREAAKLLREQHAKIWDAIRRHRPAAARQAMIDHIDFTRVELERREGVKSAAEAGSANGLATRRSFDFAWSVNPRSGGTR
jgi:GntR family transcriptional repressor for pyruvate dehydrogenase complex